MIRVPVRLFAVAMLAVLSISNAASADIGTVAEVRQGATLVSGGTDTKITKGARVDQGDLIRTNGRGLVQLVFDDGTRIAVGPRSQLVVDEVLMRNSGQASRFAVTAVTGSFRFISGNSGNKAYSVTTPTATMGVRGTGFDIAVQSRRTIMVALEGIVRMCAGGSCADGVGGCRPLLSLADGGVGTPGSSRGVERALSRGFPFLTGGQGSLDPSFHLDLAACGKIAAPPFPADVNSPEDRQPEPVRTTSSTVASSTSSSTPAAEPEESIEDPLDDYFDECAAGYCDD